MSSMWDVVPDYSVYNYTLPIMIEFTPREWALGRDMGLLTTDVFSSTLSQLTFGVVVYPFGERFEAEPRPSIGITCNNVDGPIFVEARATVVWGQFEDNVNVNSAAFNTVQEYRFDFGHCFDCQDLSLHVFVYLTANLRWNYAIYQAFDLTSFGILYSEKETVPVPLVIQKVAQGVALTPAETYQSTQLPSSAFVLPLSFDVPAFDTPYLLAVDFNHSATPTITDDADDYDDTKLYVADCVMIRGAASHLNLQRNFSQGNSFLCPTFADTVTHLGYCSFQKPHTTVPNLLKIISPLLNPFRGIGQDFIMLAEDILQQVMKRRTVGLQLRQQLPSRIGRRLGCLGKVVRDLLRRTHTS
uniref:BPI2 domain-containing protein n=1 Tax=Panagrellus redivivus TaxID=6233 RepID=A0A7E4VKX5_PANRE